MSTDKGIIELGDAFVGGKRPGGRGYGADGKTAILVAAGNRALPP
jgi:hypothetical protein